MILVQCSILRQILILYFLGCICIFFHNWSFILLTSMVTDSFVLTGICYWNDSICFIWFIGTIEWAKWIPCTCISFWILLLRRMPPLRIVKASAYSKFKILLLQTLCLIISKQGRLRPIGAYQLVPVIYKEIVLMQRRIILPKIFLTVTINGLYVSFISTISL